MQDDTSHDPGHFIPPYPGYGYAPYGYPMYPGPRGYPGPAGYPPPMYPPYGYPPPPPLLNRPYRLPQQRGRGEAGKEKRSAGKPLHSLTPAQTAGGISNDYCSRLCCSIVTL